MNEWATFWACVLLAAVSLFGVLALVVAIGGVGDIKSLIAKLREAPNGDRDPGDS